MKAWGAESGHIEVTVQDAVAYIEKNSKVVRQ